MPTIGHILTSASPDRELLLRHILGFSKTELLLHIHEELPPQILARLARLEGRRARGIPLQYIIGNAWFYGLNYTVGEGVLIPRPETELIVDRARSIIQEHTSCSVVDIGTGPGTIAIAIAHNEPATPVYAMDISRRALRYARMNAKLCNVSITFAQKNIRSSIIWPQTDHVILTANLPYLSDDRMSNLPDEVTREPYRALYGGHDGLDLYISLAKQIKRHKKPNQTVHVLCEIDPEQKTKLATIIRREFPNHLIEFHHDLHGDIRLGEITL